MIRRIRAIGKKEYIQLLRDWRSLTVAVMLPVILLLLYGYGINLDVRHLKTAVLDQDMSRQSRELLDSFEQSGYFDFVVRMDSYSDLTTLLDYGRVSVAIVVPRGFTEDIARNGKAEIQVVVDGSDSSIAGLAINYATRITREFSEDIMLREIERRGMNAAAVPKPEPRTRFWYNPELNSTHFMVPGLVALILMLLSSLLTSMTIVRERERGTIEQIMVSPIRPQELVLGKLIPYVILAFLDITLVIVAGKLIFDVPLVGSLPLLMFTSALFLIAALGLGMLISSVANSQLIAMIIAVLATMLPTILLSGFIFPIASMPVPIRLVTYLVPARYYLVIVRGIFLKGVGLSILWPEAAFLLATGVVLIALSAREFKKVL